MTSTRVDGRILKKNMSDIRCTSAFVYSYTYNMAGKGGIERGGGEDSPNDIALEQDPGHDILIDGVDLADLGQLQGARRAREEEAHNDEDGVVEDADGHVLGEQGQDGRHDERRQHHAADQTRDEQLLPDDGLLRLTVALLRVTREVGAQDHEDQGDGHASRAGHGAGHAVLDERALLEKEPLQIRDGGDDHGEEHGPQRRVHEFPEESVGLGGDNVQEIDRALQGLWQARICLLGPAGDAGGRLLGPQPETLRHPLDALRDLRLLVLADARERHNALVVVAVDVLPGSVRGAGPRRARLVVVLAVAVAVRVFPWGGAAVVVGAELGEGRLRQVHDGRPSGRLIGVRCTAPVALAILLIVGL